MSSFIASRSASDLMVTRCAPSDDLTHWLSQYFSASFQES